MAKILVVDDNELNLRLAVAIVEYAGHEVLSAADGAEAIEMALAHLPDLIFMDVQMPGVDGVAALRRLRAEPRSAGSKIVALTALAMQGDAEWLLAEGFDGYLEKPIHYLDFVASIAAMLDGVDE